MTLVGILGILGGLLAYPFALRRADRSRVLTFFGLLIVHAAAGAFYYYWQQDNTSDSILYYYDEYGFYGAGFQLSTVFVIYLVQFLRSIMGGSYLDYFLLFQVTGFLALVFIMRTFQEIYEDLRLEQPIWTHLILFLPSLHFWTSSIGKDGPLALGAAMTVWASLAVTRRYIVFLAGVGIMVLFRPHIAMVSIAAFAIALFLEHRSKLHVRVGLGAIVLAAVAAVAISVRTTFAVDVTSAESIGEFVSSQTEISKQFDTGTAVLNASFPVRLLSLLFRPFFLDAGGAMGIVASLENVLMIVVLVTFARNLALFRRTFSEVLFFRYATIYSAAIILLLAVVYYNVGLGLRQRTMMLPALLSMFVALCALLGRRRPVLGRVLA